MYFRGVNQCALSGNIDSILCQIWLKSGSSQNLDRSRIWARFGKMAGFLPEPEPKSAPALLCNAVEVIFWVETFRGKAHCTTTRLGVPISLGQREEWKKIWPIVKYTNIACIRWGLRQITLTSFFTFAITTKSQSYQRMPTRYLSASCQNSTLFSWRSPFVLT